MCCAEHRVGLLLIQYVDKSYYGCYLCSRLMFQKLVKMIVDTMICEYHPKMLVVIHRCEPRELNSTIVCDSARYQHSGQLHRSIMMNSHEQCSLWSAPLLRHVAYNAQRRGFTKESSVTKQPSLWIHTIASQCRTIHTQCSIKQASAPSLTTVFSTKQASPPKNTLHLLQGKNLQILDQSSASTQHFFSRPHKSKIINLNMCSTNSTCSTNFTTFEMVNFVTPDWYCGKHNTFGVVGERCPGCVANRD